MAAALTALVLIGLLAAGGFASSQRAYRGARNALVEQRAFTVAEYGLNKQMANWKSSYNLPPTAGGFDIGKVADSAVFVAADDTARVRITRLSAMLYWIESIGRANIPQPQLQATRDVSVLVRLTYPTIQPKGAITTAGNISVGGSASVDGRDTIPYYGTSGAWNTANCASMRGPDLPALDVPPGAKVSVGNTNILSKPAFQRDASAADSNTYVRFGTENWNTLTQNATIKLPPGVYGTDIAPIDSSGTCKADPLNWGEPFHSGAGMVASCADYYPIIYISGDVTLNGKGRGQGILLINGSLTINGTFDFAGIIIARDDVNKGNGTAKITGAVMARNVDLGNGSSIWNGNQTVAYSKCAVESALRGSAVLRPVRERAWAQLF